MTTLTTYEIKQSINDIQKDWALGIIKIGKAYIAKQDYLQITSDFLDNLYNFDDGKILFKPTKASEKQFRRSKEEFISYFIGYNKISDQDKGFALEPWKKVHFDNFDIVTYEKISLSMGNYYFTSYKGEMIKVEYSFGYKFNDEKKCKIIFHHSSFPYTP